MPASTHTGGCHCGQVRFTVTIDLDNVIECNCSVCTKHGFLWGFVAPAGFRLDSGEHALTGYHFNRNVIHHQFCSFCGVESFARGRGADGGEMMAINVRSLDRIDLSALKPRPFDGRAL